MSKSKFKSKSKVKSKKSSKNTSKNASKNTGKNTSKKISKNTSKKMTRTLEGTYTAHPKGFGFVTVEGYEEDFFIPGKYRNGAFHNDVVAISILPKAEGKRVEAEIVDILEHQVTTVVGRFEKSKNFGFVVPDDSKMDRDIFIPQGKDMHALKDDKVVCQITSYGKKDKKPEGVIVEILGDMNAPGTDILSVVKAADIPTEFPEKVLKQAVRVSKDVSEADMEGRMDLRDVQMVTIDGEDSKDLDDAVSLQRKGSKYILGVHIADVTNYVQEGSALDVEALKRGTSVYLADRVIPMLPVELSNGICSLNEGVDRLALSCIMTLDRNGRLVDHLITESVIRVDRRMTYTSVKKILVDKDKEEKKKYKDLVPMFKLMAKVSGLIRANRKERGSIDFDFQETKVILDSTGKPVDILPYEISLANNIIEDFMLMANETVAKDFYDRGLPFLYRTHAKPDPEKMESLMKLMGGFGVTMLGDASAIKPKQVQELLDKISGTQEEPMITRLVLRSMQQARYTVECNGHFGLAAPYYCHFTSPIRRYPDLQIHRIIKETLRGRMDHKRIGHYAEILPEVATETSSLERRAEEAERNVTKMKKAEYMEEHLGEVYTGHVSGVTAWGLYVELPNTVEGLIHITELNDDYYVYSEETFELIGESKNRHYKLGQEVRVQVTGADRHLGTVDFVLAKE